MTIPGSSFKCVAIDANGGDVCDIPYFLYATISKQRYKQTSLWLKQGQVFLKMALLITKSVLLIAPAIWFICCAFAVHSNSELIKSLSVGDIFSSDVIRLVFLTAIAVVIFHCSLNPRKYGYENFFHAYLVDELKKECPQLQFVQDRIEFVSFAINHEQGVGNDDSQI